jgi:hypothetical protein
MSKQYEKLVGTVPARIVQQAKLVLTTHDGKVAEFNVAAWLQLPGQIGRSLSLLARYRDGNTVREVAIDHGRVDQVGKILLSGVANLPVRHSIEELQIVARSIYELNAVTVDELFAQPAAPAEPTQLQVQA